MESNKTKQNKNRSNKSIDFDSGTKKLKLSSFYLQIGFANGKINIKKF